MPEKNVVKRRVKRDDSVLVPRASVSFGHVDDILRGVVLGTRVRRQWKERHAAACFHVANAFFSRLDPKGVGCTRYIYPWVGRKLNHTQFKTIINIETLSHLIHWQSQSYLQLDQQSHEELFTLST